MRTRKAGHGGKAVTGRAHLKRPTLSLSTLSDALYGFRQLLCGGWADKDVGGASDMLLQRHEQQQDSVRADNWVAHMPPALTKLSRLFCLKASFLLLLI